MISDDYIIERYTREQVVITADSPEQALSLAKGPDHIRVAIIDPPQFGLDDVLLLTAMFIIFGIFWKMLSRLTNANNISGKYSEREIDICQTDDGTTNPNN